MCVSMTYYSGSMVLKLICVAYDMALRGDERYKLRQSPKFISPYRGMMLFSPYLK